MAGSKKIFIPTLYHLGSLEKKETERNSLRKIQNYRRFLSYLAGGLPVAFDTLS